MINPFKNAEMQRAAQEQKQEQEYSMNQGLATSQEAAIDEDAMIQRKNILIQLSQWQQDRSEAMQNLFLKLAGYQYDPDTQVLSPIKWDKGLVNLYGAQKLVGSIESLDRNVMLANWDEKTLVKTLREGIAHPVRRFMFFNHNELGLNINNAETVFWMIMNTVEPTYWRGWNDGERKKDREIIKVQELRNPDHQTKRKGFMGLET